MKRLLSIFFLIIFLFNVGGYYIVFWGMEHQAKKNLLQRLDADTYSQNEVVVLSIPLTLPYPIHHDDYERVNGEFLHNGQNYKLIKQKVENDTLFIVCFHDREATKIASVLADYSKFANDIPGASKQALNFLAKLYKDYNTTEFKIMYKSRMLFERSYYAQASDILVSRTSPVDSPPPEFRF